MPPKKYHIEAASNQALLDGMLIGLSLLCHLGEAAALTSFEEDANDKKRNGWERAVSFLIWM